MEKNDLEFRFGDRIRLKEVPNEIYSVESEILSSYDKEVIEKTKWCLTCDFEDPHMENAGNNEEDTIHQRDENKKQAEKSIEWLAILAGLKSHLQLFPAYIFETSISGRSIFFNRSSLMPRDEFDSLESRFWHNIATQDELRELSQIFPEFEKKLKYKNKFQYKFLYAIYLLGHAFLNRYYQTKLLFLVTALESLFSPGTSEISHQVSVRTAVFLSEEHSERENIFKEIRGAHNIRSGIVHGRKLSDKEDLKKAFRDTRLRVCEVLCKFIKDDTVWATLESKKSYENFLRRLDLGESNP